MRKVPYYIVPFALLVGLISCHKEDIGVSDDALLQSDKDAILNYANSKGLSGTMTPTGLYYALTKPGSSTITPANGQEAEFSYTLYALIRNATNAAAVTDKFIDSTYASKSSFVYLIAANPGLTEGLLRMHEGDQAAILLPSSFAFGPNGSSDGSVPPNAPVRLNVTLKRIRTEEQQIDEYLTANKLTPTEVTISGLRFVKTLSNSTGATPSANQTLNVRYRGQLLRARTAFDSTGTSLYSTMIGKSVPGFDEGLAKLKVGEKATLVFPSRIGYGSTGNQVIPPYAPMRFDIELVSAQ